MPVSNNSGVEGVSIRVFSIDVMPEEEKDPLLREFKRIDPELEYEEVPRWDGGGPLPPDLVLTAVQIAVAAYATGFFYTAGATHYKALHERMSQLTTKITRNEELPEVVEDLPTNVPLEISAGRVHFHFQGEPTPEQVAERLSKMKETVNSLPEEDLQLEGREAYDTGGRRNFVWDEDAKSWIEKGLRNDPNLFPESSREENTSIRVFSLGPLPRGEKHLLVRGLKRIAPDLEYEEAHGGCG